MYPPQGYPAPQGIRPRRDIRPPGIRHRHRRWLLRRAGLWLYRRKSVRGLLRRSQYEGYYGEVPYEGYYAESPYEGYYAESPEYGYYGEPYEEYEPYGMYGASPYGYYGEAATPMADTRTRTRSTTKATCIPDTANRSSITPKGRSRRADRLLRRIARNAESPALGSTASWSPSAHDAEELFG